MVGIPSIPYVDLKANHTLSGTAEPNARVLLWNPAEGRYVRTVDADASGNFDFGSIDASVPLQVKIASDNDFTCVSSSAVIKPAVSFNTLKGKVIRNITTIFSLNAANYIWAGTPKIVFSDAAGSGSGAEAFLTMAGAGELALTGFGGPPIAFELGTSPNGSAWTQPGYTIKSFTITSIGSNYTDPKCFVVGTRLIWEQDPANANQYILVGQSVSVEQSLTTSETAETIVDENSLLSNFGSTWGATNTWGDYSNPSDTGRRLLVQFPSLSTINYNVSCTTEDSTQPGPVLQEKIVEIMAATLNPTTEAVWLSAEYALYLAIIHGFEYETHSGAYVETGQPRAYDNSTPNQNLANSAFSAQANGTISADELEYLKGWLAQAVQVNAMVNKFNNDFTTWKNINSGVLSATGFNINAGLNLFFATAGEVLHQLGDVIKRWNQANATSSNTIQNFSQVFWQEWQQTKLRYPAYLDASIGYHEKIKAILIKMGNANGSDYLTGIKTNDSTGTYRWDFSGNTLQKIKIN